MVYQATIFQFAISIPRTICRAYFLTVIWAHRTTTYWCNTPWEMYFPGLLFYLIHGKSTVTFFYLLWKKKKWWNINLCQRNNCLCFFSGNLVRSRHQQSWLSNCLCQLKICIMLVLPILLFVVFLWHSCLTFTHIWADNSIPHHIYFMFLSLKYLTSDRVTSAAQHLFYSVHNFLKILLKICISTGSSFSIASLFTVQHLHPYIRTGDIQLFSKWSIILYRHLYWL